MPILRRNGERRLSAVLDSPSVLPFFFPIWGHDSTATIEHPGTAAPITDGAVIGGEDATGFSGEFRLPGANVHKGQNRILVRPCGRDQNTGIVPATVGNAAVILGLDAAGVIGQLRITIAKVNEIQAGLSSPATRLRSHCYADACRVIDALPLHTTYELDKSFATACGDRKYFGSASGSRMSASDNEHSLSILRGAEILCIEQSVFDMVAE